MFASSVNVIHKLLCSKLWSVTSLKCLLIVPEAVKDLTLHNRSTEDLQVTWTRADGDVDQYEIQLLFNDMKVFPPFHLVNTATEYRFTSLTPGRQYKILVLTISGDVQQSAFIEGFTGNWKSGSRTWLDTVVYLACWVARRFGWGFKGLRGWGVARREKVILIVTIMLSELV